MATKHELISRLRINTAHAKGLFIRAQAIATSIAKLSEPVAEGTDADTILDEARAMLVDVGQSGLDRISQHLDEGMNEIRRIAEQVEQVAGRVANLPETLSEGTIELLKETADAMEDRIAELIDMATTTFEETEQRVVTCIEETRSRVASLAEQAQNTVYAALEDLGRVLKQSRSDVDRIISTLERTRATVLTICNTVGIGASSARPVIETSVSAFSAVN
ncbi:hypothetical protein [Mesorhizobium sp. KR1-2]|uniref:hypothetical protein n=1 Tax=Mesorhizobium sp. KR1-2 TaxID=3156609 RepID=UPI0032B3D66E